MRAIAVALQVGTLRFAFLITAMLLLSAFTPAELEKAKNAKDYFKDNYWKCLATEIVQKEQTNISVDDFSLFVKAACGQEKELVF